MLVRGEQVILGAQFTEHPAARRRENSYHRRDRKVQIMLETSRLRNLHEDYARSLAQRIEAAPDDEMREDSIFGAVEFLPYGTAAGGGESGLTVEIVGTYGPVAAEYASIRRGAGILDRPQRGVIRVTGGDRRNFLNRLLTQELKDLTPGLVRNSFWLNRKGRIEADLLIAELQDATLLDLDRHQCAATTQSLREFLFTEDVEIIDMTAQMHRIAVHGRRAGEVLSAANKLAEIENGACREIEIGGAETVMARNDETREPGFELFMQADDAPKIWRALLAIDDALSSGRRRIRPIGWHAYKIARIEAGTPLMNIDFGPTNLPHETGLLRERISFTKGCYLGQEVVARMEHLGQPKQVLVGLRVESDHLPVAGGQVFEIRDASAGDQVGVVTSSTLSPMLGAAPIAFAMIRSRHAAPDTPLLVNAEGKLARARVHALRFWPE
jgi:aminomethyltransferase